MACASQMVSFSSLTFLCVSFVFFGGGDNLYNMLILCALSFKKLWEWILQRNERRWNAQVPILSMTLGQFFLQEYLLLCRSGH